MRHDKLLGVIEYKHLEGLLPDNILNQLEEQFLNNKEVYCLVLKYLKTALREPKQFKVL